MSATPPTLNAPHAITALNASEILITFGHTRMEVEDGVEGVALARSTVEWHVTISMSPTAAEHLHMVLGTTLMRYKEKYGSIPTDVSLVQRIIEAEKSTSGVGGVQ